MKYRSQKTMASEAEGLVDLARAGLARAPQMESGDAELERLIRARRRELALGSRARYAWGVGALAAAAALFLFLRAGPKHTGVLSYVAQHTALKGAPELTNYAFSDGSTVSLAPGGSMEVVSAEARAPQLRLNRGVATVRVIHRAETHWLFAAGPFDVEVVGTAFDLQWDPLQQTFSLNLREGAVGVHGRSLEQPLWLHAGQKVTISVNPARVSVVPAIPSAARPESAASAAPSWSAAVPEKPRIEPASPPQSPPANAGAALQTWRSLVNRGQFTQVIAQATARPVASCLSQCSAADLRALGDAARYSNQHALAARALLALRQRFSGTTDATVAAFLLGRTYEATHQWQEAGRFYERYLAEAPHGEFSVDAAAGKSRATQIH